MLLLFCSSAHADSFTSPDTCVVTIKSVFLKNLQGDWIKIIEPDKQVDLVSHEAFLSFFNRDGRIPEGKYVNIKIVLSEWVRVSGRIDQASDVNFTKKDGVIHIVGTASQSSALPGQIKRIVEKSPTWTGRAEEMGEILVHLDLDNGDEDETIEVTASSDFEKPLTIRKGVYIAVWMRLDLSASLRYAWQDDYAPGVPGKSVLYFMPQKNPELVRIHVAQDSIELDHQHVKLSF